jgi:AraC-like DNA-binding protein
MILPVDFYRAFERFVCADYGASAAAPLRPPKNHSVFELDVMLAAAAEHLHEPHIGLKFGSAPQATEAFGVLGLLFRSSADVRAGLSLAERYAELFGPLDEELFRDQELLRNEGPVFLPGAGKQHSHLRHFSEAILAAYVNVISRLTGSPFEPVRVDFACARPSSVHAYAETFGGAELSFGLQDDGLFVHSEILSRKLHTADPVVQQFLEVQAAAEVSKLPRRRTLISEAKRVLESYSGGTEQPVTLVDVARALAMSERTLQRRLSEQGTTFRALVDGVRMKHALRLVSDRRLSGDEIAARLGFESARSLRRSLARWTGSSLRHIRGAK